MKNIKKLIVLGAAAVMLTGCADSVERVESKSEASTEKTLTKTTEIQTAAAPTEITEPYTTAAPTEAIITEKYTIPESTEPPTDGKIVRILDYIPDAVIDLRYATENNFTGVVLYDDPEAYLCYGTVKKLIGVQNDLREKGYSILIWDAYRSPEAQQRLWNEYPDPMFVADPRNGITSHSRGDTVDIAIVRLDGSSVELPSEFDEFNSAADRDYSDVSEIAAANARILEEAMYNNGFTGYAGEWWDYSDTDRYELEFD